MKSRLHFKMWQGGLLVLLLSVLLICPQLSGAEDPPTEPVDLAAPAIPGVQALALVVSGDTTGAENHTLSVTVQATAPEGVAITYSAKDLPDGAIFNPKTGQLEWTPDYSQAGVYAIVFSASDGTRDVSKTVRVTIDDVNRAPLLAEIGTLNVREGDSLRFTISGFDADEDGLTYSALDLPDGAGFNPVTRQFRWTPSFDTTENSREFTVNFKVTDGSLSASETVLINVENVNRAPQLDKLNALSIDEGEALQLVLSAADPDGDELFYTADNLPAGAVFNSTTAMFSWRPTLMQAGLYHVTFRVSDGSLTTSQTVPLQVINRNQAPVLDEIAIQQLSESVTLDLILTATDLDNDALHFKVENLPPGASFDAERQRLLWTPNFSQSGPYRLRVDVSDGQLSDAQELIILVANSNRSPQIEGTPDASVVARDTYRFLPRANDPDGDPLSFSITNKPAWANFDRKTGELSGEPTEQQLGQTAPIAIGVSDGSSIVFLPLFTIEVLPFTPKDTDGDGVFDHLDSFPEDPQEWLDSDGDQVGNNLDNDDDNDGVADIRDGAPLDRDRSGWVVSAISGDGGFITPEGATSVLYGGAQTYRLTPMAGYFVKDLRVDGRSLGAMSVYRIENITTHHQVEAIFTEIPYGFSVDPIDRGLPGVWRSDAGEDQNNLASGKPKLDLSYRFQISFRSIEPAEQIRVALILNGYRYPLRRIAGELSKGASYAYTTMLGPISGHSYYFVAEDDNGKLLWRYPGTGELKGPEVALLNGKNLIGLPASAPAGTFLPALRGQEIARWLPDDQAGRFALIGNEDSPVAGEGYLLQRGEQLGSLDLSTISDNMSAEYRLPLVNGWNLIANPYRGHVELATVRVAVGERQSVAWGQAVAERILAAGAYSYLGDDWEGGYDFISGPQAVLVPGIGYWIYLHPNAPDVSLLMSRPQRYREGSP